MKQLLIFVFTFFLVQLAIAQDLHVVKDNIACAYGLKDAEGNWVVEAKYILIEEYNTGYFQVRDEMGVGVFTPKGKELIPCIHDQIKTSMYNWRIRGPHDGLITGVTSIDHVYFYGAKGDEQLVYNLQGRKLGSFGIQTDFDLDTDYSIIGYNRFWRSSKYIDSSGVVLIDSIQGELAPFMGEDYSLVGANLSGNRTANGNVRVVNRKGELILKMTMDRATIDLDRRVCFTIDKRYGVISLTGDTVIAPKYKRIDGELQLNAKKMWPIYDEKDRSGVMKNDGTILIEPTFDHVHEARGLNRAQIAWMVEKDKRFGLLDLEGRETIPMNYDQLYPVHFMQNDPRALTTNYIGRSKGKYFYLDPKAEEVSSVGYDSIFPIDDYNYSYSLSFTHGLITKKNGKYGVLNRDGSELEACVYDFRFLSYRGHYLLGREGNLTEFGFDRDSISRTEWSPALSDGTLNIYSGNGRYIAIEQSKKGGKTMQVEGTLQSFHKYGDLLVAQRIKTGEWLIFNLSTKKRLPLKNLVSVQSNGRNQLLISTRMNHYGIIDVNGNLIVDTIYNNITLNRYSSNSWATKITENRHVNILLDSVGRQVIPNQFDASFELNSGDQVVSQNQKKGLIDSKTLQWKIRPDHFCLLRLFDDYYYAGNELNQKGILKADGKVVLPIAYDTIILLYTNCQLNGACPGDDATQIRWIVRKGNTEYLADEHGKLINSKSTIHSWKARLFFGDDTLISGYNQGRSFPVLDYTPSLHFLRGLTLKQIQNKRKALWKNPILKDEVLDTINRIWKSYVPNCSQGYYWDVTTIGDQAKPTPLAEKARKSCDCFQSNRYSFSGDYLVYQLRSIGEKFVTIDLSYQNQNNGWDQLRGQAPPAIPTNLHINIIEKNGKAQYISLKDIFPDDDSLMQEFIRSLQKRDDLKLDCSSIENMLEMINGNYSISDEGVHVYLNQTNQFTNSPVELLIPIANLMKLPNSKWIVPILSAD